MAMASVSPWAQTGNQQASPPDMPQSVWAGLDPQAAAAQAAISPAPAKATMPAQMSNVALAPKAPSPEEKQIAADEARLEKIQWQQQNPWGTAENHPGKLGKVAHVFSTLGNIAGDIFAPATMANIPGTQLNREVEGNQLAKRLNTEENTESENQYRGAETGKTQEETALAPGKAASEEALQSEQGENIESEIASRNEPDLAKAYAHAVNQAIKNGQDPANDPIVQHLGDAITNIQKQATPKGMEHVDIVGPDGKPMQANYDPLTGRTTDSTGKVIQNPKPYEKPNEAGMLTMIAPDPNTPGGGIVERLGAGAHIAPGSQTAAGVNAENTPTMQQRTASGRAATVVAMAPEVLGRIDSVASKLGPMEGRWNDFMAGKIGAEDPDFQALRADLLMMSSAVALAHAQGRLPENLREEFDRAINAPKQTPDNLKATINTMIPWLQKMQEQGRPNTPSAGAAQGGGQKVLTFNRQTGRLE